MRVRGRIIALGDGRAERPGGGSAAQTRLAQDEFALNDAFERQTTRFRAPPGLPARPHGMDRAPAPVAGEEYQGATELTPPSVITARTRSSAGRGHLTKRRAASPIPYALPHTLRRRILDRTCLSPAT